MTRYIQIALIFGAALLAGCDRGQSDVRPAPAPRQAEATVYRVPLDDAAAQGTANAPVTVVEFSDYQCPFCGRANGTIEQLRSQYGSQLRVVMRQHPLPGHPQAMNAALAALAAGEQGKFWEMHGLLFGHQRELSPEAMEGFAKQLGLDLAKFDADRQSARLRQIVERDSALAMRLGASATPTFFINGRKLVGAQPIDNFRATIDGEIAHAATLTRAGTAPERVYEAIVAQGLEGAAPAAQPTMPAHEDCGSCDGGADCKGGGAAAEIDSNRVEKLDLRDVQLRGPASAPVTIVAFTDFECPYCARAEQTLRQLEQANPGKLRLAVRQKPLGRHPHAREAAKAALAAGEQGKYWEMHELLFAHRDALERAALEDYARQLGLDLPRFKAALDSPALEARLEADERESERLDVQGTPTFFVNGRRLTGAHPLERFQALVDQGLKDH